MARFGFGLGFRSQSSQFAPIFGSESRNFTTLDASGSKHYTMPVYTMAVGDIVSFTFLAPTSTTSVEYLFDSDTASLRANCLLNIGGSFAVNGFESTMLLDGNSVSTGSTYPIDGKLHTLELTSNTVNEIGRVGSRYSGANTYNGVIFDFKIKRGSDLKRFYKLDETWIGPSTVAVDSGSDGSNGTAVNITPPDSENFNFDGSVSPNTWTNDAETRVIEVAGT